MSAFLDNAIESVRVGIDFYLNRPERSAHKHATLLLFHAIELLLKERLSEAHGLLIYAGNDDPITEDAPMVGLEEALDRIRILGLVVDPDQATVLQGLQRRRGWVERHAYDRDPDDGIIVGQSIGFIVYFLREFLDTALEDHIDADLLARVGGLSYDTSRVGGPGTERFAHAMGVACDRQYLRSTANGRLDEWVQQTYPNDDTAPWGTAGSFYGTEVCPVCREELLVMESHPEAPYCFFCQSHVTAARCEHCGSTYPKAQGPSCTCDLWIRA